MEDADEVTSLLMTPAALVRRHVVAPLARAVGRPLPSPLRDQVVLVTGASSGVGEALALEVARRGAVVLCVARREAELERVVAEVVAEGGRAAAYACDLTDAEAVDELAARVERDHGRVDYLVNNAGRSIRRSLELSYDRAHDFERTMAVNFHGPVRLTLGLLPGMRERRHGHVVNVVTWGVQLKAPKFAAYIASKTALDTFARIAGREAWRDGVTFTNVRLDLVRTDMITATEAYRDVPARTPQQAAAMVVRALEDRPVAVNTLVGRAGEVLDQVAPRVMDLVMATIDGRTSDSKAARAGVGDA